MLNIVVIGTGMYSTGRGTNAFGTVLPAVNEWMRLKSQKNKVVFVGNHFLTLFWITFSMIFGPKIGQNHSPAQAQK